MIQNFNEEAYLEANTDVREAIERGDFPSVALYLKHFGLQRIQHGKTKFHKDLEPFSTASYLEAFPEVEGLVKSGAFPSVFDHFRKVGYSKLLEDLHNKDSIINPLKKDISVEERLIIGFDEEAYLEANQDVKEALERGDFPSVELYLKHFGLKRIEKGVTKFHKDHAPFSVSSYLNLFPDVQFLVDSGEFSSVFDHFCQVGYADIIVEKIKLVVEEEDTSTEKVIVILGIPRSGLTLTTSLLSGNCNASAWFLPYATRKNVGIEPFTDFNSIKNAYAEAFPDEKSIKNTLFISETTADENSVDFIVESLNNLKKEGVEAHILWLTRNLHHTYISQMETAFTYWGAEEPSYSEESYQSYIDFTKRSYLQIVEIADHFDTALCSYEKFLQDPIASVHAIYNWFDINDHNVSDDLKFENRHVAGDPSFSPEAILNDRSNIREAKWQEMQDLDNSLEPLSKLFVEAMQERLEALLLSPSMPFAFDRYKKILLEKYFDATYYKAQYEDIKKNRLDPLEHYISFGWKEGRNPSANFETKWYKENFFDDGHTPSFLHFLLMGRFQTTPGRSIGIMENLKIIDPESYEITDDLVLVAPKFKNPKVSIVVPAYNEEKYSMACIQSIIENTEDDVSYEIIFMDDKSPDESARLIEQNLRNVKFITNGVNYGFLKNCNKGATFAIGEYILFLNNDTNVQPGWLSSLVELIESADDIGMVGSRLVYPTGQQQEAGGIVWNDASGWNFGRLDDPNKPEYNYVKEADYLTGAAMMIRTSLWEEIGGFDERYVPAYYEDSDLAFEVRKHGYRAMYQPKSVVIHFEGISNGTDLGSGIKKYQVVNKENFFNKWKDVLETEHFPNAQDVFLARDRSKSKKHILIIDHYVPHFDQDAGSRTMWQYLLLFKDLGYHVTFAGDNFFKHEPYTSMLENYGIEVLYGEYYANNFDSWLDLNGKYLDIVYLLRPHISIKYIDRVRKYTEATIFYNGTDFHFLRMQREYDITQDPALLIDLENTKKDEIHLFEKSDCVLTISEFERDYFNEEFPQWNVELIPTYIYSEDLPLSQNSFKKREDILFVGGFVHKPNLEGVKWFLKEIWPLITNKIPDIKFYIVGSNMPEEIKDLQSDTIIPKGFVSDEELALLYNSTKIVVAPLTFGAGVKGKIIEAICNGVPTVTTSVGAEGIIDANTVLSITDKSNQFAKKVIKLYSDKKKWNSMREEQIIYARKHFSLKNVKTYIDDVFSKDYK